MFSFCYWFSAFLSYIFFIHKLIVQIKTVSVDHSLIILSLFSLSLHVGALFYYFQLSNNIDYLLFVYASSGKNKVWKFNDASLTLFLHYVHFVLPLPSYFMLLLFLFLSICLGLYLKFNLIFPFLLLMKYTFFFCFWL
jgi:hypothetical protein